jgi:hypothetical protein
MTNLTKKDYEQILEYYNKPIPKSKKVLKTKAENILRNKLCRCIKKVDPVNEGKSIGICTKTIFNRKGLTHGKFNCKKKSTFKIQKIKNKKYTKRNK